MKKFALGVALGVSLISTGAFAGEQRPTYLAFNAPASVASATVSPAVPSVAKRNKALGPVPLFVPIVGAVTVLGFIVAVSTGGDGSPG